MVFFQYIPLVDNLDADGGRVREPADSVFQGIGQWYITGFDLYGHERLIVSHNQKINFPFINGPDIVQLEAAVSHVG